MKPLISHVIAAYQQEAFIEAAVRSAVEQDFDSLEVIVTDDGSKDRTVELLSALQNEFPKRLKVLSGNPNGGVTTNFNRAMAIASGELFSFQGGDDLLLPGKFAKQADWFKSNPDAVLCGHLVEHFYDPPTLPAFVREPFVREGHGADAWVRRGMAFDGTSLMVRRSALPSPLFDQRIATISDWLYFVEALAAGGRFGFLDTVLARYRLHPANVMRVESERIQVERFMVLGIIEARHPHLASACQEHRARLRLSQAQAAFDQGDLDRAGLFARLAVQASPDFSWRSPALWAASRVPMKLSLSFYRWLKDLRAR